jgi:hypothetical protein
MIEYRKGVSLHLTTVLEACGAVKQLQVKEHTVSGVFSLTRFAS